MILVDKEKQQERFAICESCEHLTKLKFCDICDCYMPVKTTAAWVKCPINKWGKIVERKD